MDESLNVNQGMKMKSNQSQFMEVELAESRKPLLIRKDEVIAAEPVNSWEYPGQPHTKIKIRRASALLTESLYVKQHFSTIKTWLTT